MKIDETLAHLHDVLQRWNLGELTQGEVVDALTLGLYEIENCGEEVER